MLDFLAIRDFAVIADASIEFSPGFNVLTGETGAGKSMIVSALDLLRGERASAHFVRAGAPAAVVEAQFHLERPTPGLLDRLREHGLSEDDPQLILERVISTAGRGRQRIGGRLTTTAALAELVPQIIEISSQHDSLRLLSAGFALQVLDDFGGHGPLRADLDARVAALDALAARLEGLGELARTRDLQRETLEHLIGELTAADLSPGEHERLLVRRRYLASLRELLETARYAEEALSASEGSVQDRVHAVLGRLRKHAEVEPRFLQAADLLEEARIGIDEAVSLLRLSDGEDEDPESLDRIEERLFRISRLLRKHHCEDEAALLALADRSRAELAELENVDVELASQERQMSRVREAAVEAATALGQARTSAAVRFGERVTAELAELGFANARLFVELPQNKVRTDTPGHRRFGSRRLGAAGFESAEFWFEPNPGQAPQPVGRGASGGELSRIHLALQGVLADRSEVAVTLYDEVDAGIGGQVAVKIGEKLRRLSRVRQVLCITHLPQIAAHADTHFLVEKTVQDGQTLTTVRPLDPRERVAELARMLGGATPEALAHAASLLGQAAREEGR